MANALRRLALALWSPEIRLGTRRFTSLDGVIPELEGATGLPGERLGGRSVLANVRFSGERNGRRVSLSFAREVEDTRATDGARVVLDLGAPHPGGTVAFRRATARDSFARFFRIEGPFTRSMGPLLVNAVFVARVERLLRSPFAPLAVRAFDRFDLRTLVLESRTLTATLPAGGIEPADYGALLTLLEDLARADAEHALRVTVTGEGGSVRCAYCHDDSPDLPCERCGARLHGSCWEDHGSCPVFGCGGRPDPARDWLPVNRVAARVDASPGDA